VAQPAVDGQTPPPPPPLGGPDETGPEPKRSNFGVLMGLHLGAEAAGGDVSLPSNATGPANGVGSGGVTYGLDGGIRLGHHFYIGLTLDHAQLNDGQTDKITSGSYTRATSETTHFGVVGAFIGNTEHVSFYGELGLAGRWLSVTTYEGATSQSATYGDTEFDMGLGVWIPIGHRVRLLPKATLGFITNKTTTSEGNDYTALTGFGMLGLQGMYNIDL
jgi:hypothetical protein